MFWKIPNNPLRRIGIRLVLIITVVAVAASLLVYGLLFGSLSKGFRDENRAELDSLLLSYWAAWDFGGNDAVIQQMSTDMLRHGGRPFLLLLKNSTGHTINGLIPGGWDKFNLDTPSMGLLYPSSYLALKSREMDYSLLLTGAIMADDTRLIVGISTENQESLLRLYKRNYPAALIGIILACIAVGLFASSRLLQPIRRLNREIDHIIKTGVLNRRLDSQGTGDQLDGLIGRYNRLLDRVELLIGGMKNTLDAVAHDLRTPLTRLRVSVELALKETNSGSPETDSREVLNLVVEQADQMGTLLSDLLEIAEAENGMLQLNTGPCNLGDIVKEVVEMYEFIAEEKNQRIEIHIPESLQSRMPMQADPPRLRRILGNLLDNAVKYSPRDSSIYVCCLTEPDCIAVEVRDRGPGIAPEDVSRIFDRCFRGDHSRGSRGLGMGLSIAKALSEAHGGSISVRNEEDGETCFRVEFPHTSLGNL